MNSGNDQTDKILQHNQEQLSALMDGALSPDEARFLLRRLQHDEVLAQCWSRWQLCGDILRGQAQAPAPTGFAQRVAAAIAAHDPQTTTATQADAQRNRAWWGSGMALAASVAVLALFATRQSPEMVHPADLQPAQIATSQVPAGSTQAGERVVATPSRSTPARSVPAGSILGLPDAATGLAAVAVAELPRRASARRSRGQSQRAALRTTRDNAEPRTVLAVSTPSTEHAVTAFATTTTVDPFRRPQTAAIPARPWPRTLLSQSDSSGAFNVDYGSQDGTTSARFYPFRPQIVLQDASLEETPVQEISSPVAPASDDANQP